MRHPCRVSMAFRASCTVAGAACCWGDVLGAAVWGLGLRAWGSGSAVVGGCVSVGDSLGVPGPRQEERGCGDRGVRSRGRDGGGGGVVLLLLGSCRGLLLLGFLGGPVSPNAIARTVYSAPAADLTYPRRVVQLPSNLPGGSR